MKTLIRLLVTICGLHSTLSTFFDDLLQGSTSNGKSDQTIPNTGSELESLVFRSCYVCHGTSISAVTSSCWETVNEDHKRFVSVQTCFGACSITVLNQTNVGLVEYTRKCERNCVQNCVQNSQNTHLCKYCCYGDRCNNILPTYVPEVLEKSNNASVKNIRRWLTRNVMTKPRHHSIDPSNKISARKLIVTTWREFGIHPEMQNFTISKTVVEEKSPLNYRSYIRLVIRGYNIIATIRGRYYGTLDDRIIVIIAHYDTHIDGTPGVDENASGVAALLELTRLFWRNETCTRNHTILLVATDFSKEGSFWDNLNGRNYTNCILGDQYIGLSGSSHFLCGYLLPYLRRTGSRLMVAFNIHSILNYDTALASQSLEDLQDFITGAMRYNNEHYRRFEDQVARRKYVGDWVMTSYADISSTPERTQFYANLIANEWNGLRNYDLKTALIKQHIPVDGTEHIIMQQDDCLPFLRLREPLPCVSLTDTGPLRGYMRRCYQQLCDDASQVTEERLQFMAKITETMWKSVEKLSVTSCPVDHANSRQNYFNNKDNSKRKQKHSSSKSCNKALLEAATQQRNSSVSVTATCRYTPNALLLCIPPSSRVWGTLNNKIAWIPKKTKKKRSKQLWFQIDLGRRTTITALAIQGVRGRGFIRSFRLSFSDDGETWNWYTRKSSHYRSSVDIRGASNDRKPRKRPLNPIIQSQFLRLHPRSWKRRIALRFEAYGCL